MNLSKELIFKNFSFSSTEDVYEVVWMLDAIMEESDNFNLEAIALKNDFLSLANKINDDVLNEYILIQSGKKPMTNSDYGKSIIEVIAEVKCLSVKECENRLKEAFDLIIVENYRRWVRYYIKNYKDKMIPNNTYVSSYEDLNDWRDIDYKKKYLWKNNIKPRKEFPKELNEVLKYREENMIKMNRLQNKSNLTNKQKDELRFLKRNQINIDKDISEMKRSFNIKISNNNQYGRAKTYSFNESFDQERENSSYLYAEKIDDSLTYSKILNIANSVLTSRQKTIFYLYFESELKQTEIAELLDDTQGNISRDIKNIIEKIRKNLQN